MVKCEWKVSKEQEQFHPSSSINTQMKNADITIPSKNQVASHKQAFLDPSSPASIGRAINVKAQL